MVRRTRDLVDLNPSCQGLLSRDTLCSAGHHLSRAEATCPLTLLLKPGGHQLLPSPTCEEEQTVPGRRWGLRPSWGSVAWASKGLQPGETSVVFGSGKVVPSPAQPLRAQAGLWGAVLGRRSFHPCTTASLRCLHRPILWVGKIRHEEYACLN